MQSVSESWLLGRLLGAVWLSEQPAPDGCANDTGAGPEALDQKTQPWEALLLVLLARVLCAYTYYCCPPEQQVSAAISKANPGCS